MEQPLFIELIHRTKSTLNTISKLTQLARGKFIDREFGEFFNRAITKDIEKHNLVLNTFLNYIASTTPIPKRNTVNRLIEELVKKRQVHLEEKRIKTLKDLEKDLPEAIVPDEQLSFILDSLLQYAMALMPSDGNIRFQTRSVRVPGDAAEDREFFERNGKYVEILVAFTGHKKPTEQQGRGPESNRPRKKPYRTLYTGWLICSLRRTTGRLNLKSTEERTRIRLS